MVEDVAVLVDLDKRSPLVPDASLVDLVHAFHVDIDAACNEGASGRDRDRDRVDREVDRSRWGGRGDLALLARRGVLPLGEAVDLVVEEHDGEVNITAHRVDGVVASDREQVAVA